MAGCFLSNYRHMYNYVKLLYTKYPPMSTFNLQKNKEYQCVFCVIMNKLCIETRVFSPDRERNLSESVKCCRIIQNIKAVL